MTDRELVATIAATLHASRNTRGFTGPTYEQFGNEVAVASDVVTAKMLLDMVDIQIVRPPR